LNNLLSIYLDSGLRTADRIFREHSSPMWNKGAAQDSAP